MRTAQDGTVKSDPNPKTKECLLRHGNFVSESESTRFDLGHIAWEASTLPLSYTRVFAPIISKKGGVVKNYNELCKEPPKVLTNSRFCDILFI